MAINKDHLTAEQIQVTQFCGTEPPFSGKLLNEKRIGNYVCAVCKEILFDSSTKYESGSGWPSFFDAVAEKIETKEDTTLGMIRTEILCKICSSHLWVQLQLFFTMYSLCWEFFLLHGSFSLSAWKLTKPLLLRF